MTPDSFSDGGEHLDAEAAIAHGLKMLDAGADIIDVGGESTRPGFTPVDPDTEAQRVLPVVKALARAGAIVSIDTRHVEVAKAAVRVGASIVNDVTGFTDPRMVDFVKESDCGVVIMHAGEVSDIERPRTHTAVQLDTSAAAFMAEKAREAEAAARALGATGKSKRAAKAKAHLGHDSAAAASAPVRCAACRRWCRARRAAISCCRRVFGCRDGAGGGRRCPRRHAFRWRRRGGLRR